ncbi:MAG: phosphate ABC transporter permease subunit PstC [Clostridia bacterium]|nr:phosphate ABC transporter permease subunit PstC [Clostridia bacterium]
MKQFRERLAHGGFTVAALTSIVMVALICVFLFAGGLPAIGRIGIPEFLLGQKWAPNNIPPQFGILPMILASIYVTLGALAVGVPIGVFTAVCLARFCPKFLYRWLKPGVELMAGIPSVIYGFFGLTVLVPAVRELFGGTGMSILVASVLLGMMILPTIVGLAESALRAVPESYYEGALALGATPCRAMFRAVLPAAKSGIMAAVVLGIGRAIGETMAVVMVVGNQARMPVSLLKGARPLTTGIVLEMGYASGLHREALIAIGVVLFVFILLINLLLSAMKRRA